MKYRVFLTAAVLLVAGCGATSPAPSSNAASAVSVPSPAAAPGDEVTVSPADVPNVAESMPFLTISNSTHRENDAPVWATINSQAELDRFISDHPGALPSYLASTDPHPPVLSDPSSPVTVYGKIDFSKYQAVYFQGKTFELIGNARVVSIEDQPTRLLVHTARWVLPTELSGHMPIYHLVAFPRTSKPVVFAPTMVAVRRPGDIDPGPRWRAVPNPELTREKVEAEARQLLGNANPTSFTLEKHTLQWLADNLHEGGGTLGNLSSNSDMWVATAEGQLSNDVYPGPIGVGVPQPSGFSRVTYLISIEDGMVLGTSAKPL